MKKTIGKGEFRDAFRTMGRQDKFTYEALGSLFDYLTQLEEDTGEEMELDVIALCCDYDEYESLDDFNQNYSIEAESLEDIEQYTTVIPVEGTDRFIIQAF